MLRTKLQINIPVTVTVSHDKQKLQIVNVEPVLLNEISTKDETGVIQNPTKLGFELWKQSVRRLNEALEWLKSCHYKIISEDNHSDIEVSNGVPVEVHDPDRAYPDGPKHSVYRLRPSRRHSTDRLW